MTEDEKRLQKVHQELMKLWKKRGKLTASEVVEAAKNAKSALHDCFEWDDTKAAHEYRLSQARHLIKRAVPKKEEEKFVHVPVQKAEEETGSKEGEYHPASHIVQEVDLYQRALGEAISYLNSAARAVEALKEAAKESPKKDQLVLVNVIVKALETAQSAAKQLTA